MSDWIDRMGYFTGELNTDKRVTDTGFIRISSELSRLIQQRIAFDKLDFEPVKLEPPLIITGLPRTGSTHLHNLIGATGQFRGLKFWEALEPFSPPEEAQEHARRILDLRQLIIPEMDMYHEASFDGLEEDNSLLSLDFSGVTFETLGSGMMPQWRDRYYEEDQTDSYRFLDRCLQALTKPDDPRRWVLKSPQHIEQLPAIRNVWPDATIVVLKRDPVECLASYLNLIHYHSQLTSHPDPIALGQYWLGRFERMLKAYSSSASVPISTMEIEYEEFVESTVSVGEHVGEICTLLDVWSRDASHGAFAYQAANKQHRHGKPTYDLERFGLDENTVKERLDV